MRKLTFGLIVKSIVSAAILIAGIVVMIGLVSSRKPPEDRANADLIPKVRTYAVDEYRGELDQVITGLVVPYREIKIAAEVAGRVAEKSKDFQPGSFVRADTILLRIDSRDYELDAQRLQSEVTQAESMLAETEQELQGATDRLDVAREEFRVQEEEHNRRLNLSSALSQTELKQSEQTYLAAQAALQAFENNVSTLQKRKTRMQQSIDLAKLMAEKAALDLERTVIRAPVDGVVVDEMVEEGDFVQRGQQLLAFEDTQKAEIRCNLTQRQLAWLLNNSPGTRVVEQSMMQIYQLPKTSVIVTAADHPGFSWTGSLERYDGIGLDERTKTIPCRVVVDQPVAENGLDRRALMRGTYVKCRIAISADQMIDQGKRFVQFPDFALQPGGYVWMIQNDTLTKKPVEIVDQVTADDGTGNVVVQWVDDGLQPGSKVVVTPMSLPVEGSPIQDIESPTSMNANSRRTAAEGVPQESTSTAATTPQG